MYICGRVFGVQVNTKIALSTPGRCQAAGFRIPVTQGTLNQAGNNVTFRATISTPGTYVVCYSPVNSMYIFPLALWLLNIGIRT